MNVCYLNQFFTIKYVNIVLISAFCLSHKLIPVIFNTVVLSLVCVTISQ